MKSNKQRYEESLKRSTGNSGKGSNGAAWFIAWFAIFCVLASIYMMWNEGILGKGDMTIGEGKPIPDADEIFKHFGR